MYPQTRVGEAESVPVRNVPADHRASLPDIRMGTAALSLAPQASERQDPRILRSTPAAAAAPAPSLAPASAAPQPPRMHLSLSEGTGSSVSGPAEPIPASTAPLKPRALDSQHKPPIPGPKAPARMARAATTGPTATPVPAAGGSSATVLAATPVPRVTENSADIAEQPSTSQPASAASSSAGSPGLLASPGTPAKAPSAPVSPLQSPRPSFSAGAPGFKIPRGHPGNLSSEQQSALDKFRAELRRRKLLGEGALPAYLEVQLLRFLRARNFDVAAAAEMYSKSEAWKREIGLDRLCREFNFEERDLVAKHGWCMYFHKTDRLGRPIFIQDLSGIDPARVFQHTTPDRIMQHFAVTLEKAVRERYDACTEHAGHLVDDNYMVLNLQGLSLGTFWSMRQQLQQLLAILDDNFPELSGRVQIINAPSLFTTVWACIKGWLPPQTAEKINICGSNYKNDVLRFVDEDKWPAYLGGKCTCGGASPQCCPTSDAGPWHAS